MSEHGNEAVTRERKQAAAQGRAMGLETIVQAFAE